MKTLTTIITGLFLLFSTSAFTPVTVSANLKTAFAKDFTEVSDTKWKKIEDDLYLASFKIKGAEAAAAYNEEGKLLSVARYITLEELPLNIALVLQDKYTAYDFNPSLIELSVNNSSSYIINGESTKHNIKLEAYPSGDVFVMSKTKIKS